VKQWSATMLVAWGGGECTWRHHHSKVWLLTFVQSYIWLPTVGNPAQSLQEWLVLPKPQMFAETQRSVAVHEGSKEWKITGRIFLGINLLAYSQRMQQHIQRMD
jgi:hypothetical protein